MPERGLHHLALRSRDLAEDVKTPNESYEVTLLFPNKLPPWFREGEIGTSLIPLNWAEVNKDFEDGRRRIHLRAQSLEPEKKYTLKFDVSEPPEPL